MSRKRRNTSSAEPESPPAKRRQSSSHDEGDDYQESSGRPQLDKLTGLTSAFPGLASSDVQFYGPARDGLDYLRMVRTEASSIPNCLRAPDLHHDDDTNNPDRFEDYDGFFDQDEAVVAPPSPFKPETSTISRVQQLYHASLLRRFRITRSGIQSTPPLDVIRALPESIPISFPPSSRTARQAWEGFMATNIPHPVQIACIDADTVFGLIRMVTKKMRKFFQSTLDTDIQRIGIWIWAILAKCPETGQLGSEEIADLRACARAANTTWDWLRDRIDGVALDEHLDDEDEDEEPVVVGSISAQNKQPQAASIKSSYGDACRQDESDAALVGATRDHLGSKQYVILDMIITIVGETYGQRDLLELRRPWDVKGHE